jgi:ribosome-binding protein aMBF1 (putative translation factor)
MQDARLELKLSQKDVAQKVNEKPSVIQDYESSKAIPNPQILGKLERALGVKLRGLYIIFLWYLFPKSHCPVQALTLGENWMDQRKRNLHPFGPCC